MEVDNSKQVLLSVFGVAILVIAVFGVSFAAFNYSKTGTKVNTITTGTITMSYTEPDNGINLANAMPMSDSQGKVLTGDNNVFDFTVTTTIVGTATVNYTITATKEGDSTIPDTGVKVYLTNMDADADSQILAPTLVSNLSKTGSSELSGAPANQYILKSDSTTSSVNHKYRLRMWVADTYTVGGTSQTYKLRVNVYGKAPAQ